MRAVTFRARVAAATLFLLLVVLSAVPASAGGPVTAGMEVRFTNMSTSDPLLFTWDFDYDGLAPIVDSLEQHPVWVFETEGVYEVFLESCNAYGCGNVSKTVVVQSDPDLIFADGLETGNVGRWSATIGN